MDHEPCYQLLHQCATVGDSANWEEFLERFGGRLKASVRRAVFRSWGRRGRHLEEDMLQEVYCRLLERGGRTLLGCRGRTPGEVRVYLERVAESVVVDCLRSASAAKRGRGRLTDLERQGGSLADRIADPGSSPEEHLLGNELRRRFLQRCRALARGKTAARSVGVLRLAILEGWSSREISERFGGRLAPTSVDSLVHRMRRRLAEEGLLLGRR